MRWPTKEICKRIGGLWARWNGSTYAGEKQNALDALRRLQTEYELSDAALAYSAESYNNTANVLDLVLSTIQNSKTVLKFEQAFTAALWSLHTYVYDQFRHTPRLLVESYEPECGKTSFAHLMEGLVHNPDFSSSVSPAVIYHTLRKCQHTTLILDEIEHSTLWAHDKLLLQVTDAGHRKGGNVKRVIKGEVLEFPVFAPLMMMAVWQQPFPRQLLSRAILFHLEKQSEGRDEIDHDDPKFLPVRDAQSQWASEFQRPKACELPHKLKGRAGDNWRVLIEIADTLGYSATVRAVALAMHQPTSDPATLLCWDIYQVFEARNAVPYSDVIWRDELVDALCELPDAHWDEYGLDQGLLPRKLTANDLRILLRAKGIRSHSVRKGEKTGKGFRRQDFEQVWLSLFGVTPSRPNKIIKLIRHNQRHSDSTE